jgi:hypothetical protein
MGYQFNPFTGNFDNVGSGGGGNPFDQSLNTTDSPQFVDVVANDILAAPTVTWGYGAGTASQGNTDGSISLFDRPNFTGFPTPPNNTLLAVANDLWFYRSGSNKYKVMLSGYSSSSDLTNSSNISLKNTDNSFTSGQTITPASANTSALTASYSVTGANTTPLLNLSGTWNTTGIAKGLLLNITDTASNASSLLLDLQTSSVSKFKVDKFGIVTSVASYSGTSYNASQTFVINGDTVLARDAANIFAQRAGTNAQTNRIYNTYTDASNYERAVFDWTTTANTLTIGTQAAGTGTVRNININVGAQANPLIFTQSGTGIKLSCRDLQMGVGLSSGTSSGNALLKVNGSG